MDFLPNGRFHDLRFHEFDVYLILKGTNPNKTPGPNGIHGIILKNCASSLAKPITTLFNCSYTTGCIPAEWKLASVVPVHKKDDKRSVENYRPISLTSLFMKVFENCIKTSLLTEVEGYFDRRQHGFLYGKSHTTQMVPFVDNLAVALNNKSRIELDVIYSDFAKAFDIVSHDLILHKLKFREGREQQVLVVVNHQSCRFTQVYHRVSSWGRSYSCSLLITCSHAFLQALIYSRVAYIYVRSRAKCLKFRTTTSKFNIFRKPLMQQKYYFIHEM